MVEFNSHSVIWVIKKEGGGEGRGTMWTKNRVLIFGEIGGGTRGVREIGRCTS